jgi:hypothetical protein
LPDDAQKVYALRLPRERSTPNCFSFR